jgi:hypothetical protein
MLSLSEIKMATLLNYDKNYSGTRGNQSRFLIAFILLFALSACNISISQNIATVPVIMTESPSSSLATDTRASAVTAKPDKPLQPNIESISLCITDDTGSRGSCPKGLFDSLQVVFGPNDLPLNQYGVSGVTDQHISVFPPNLLQGNTDYLFFFAGGSDLHRSIGVVALSGGTGPKSNGQWNLIFSPDYGYYTGKDQKGKDYEGSGQIFQAPIDQGYCPVLPNIKHAQQDQTFDLNYAAAGSVVPDPSSRPGSLLMIYGASNACIGSTGGPKPDTGAYISVGLATSLNYGRTWPTYRKTQGFDFVMLPNASQTQGPNAPFGAMGQSVCIGNDCTTIPPVSYGRYAILTPPDSLVELVESGNSADGAPHDAEPAAFVDDVGADTDVYIYEIHNYSPWKNADPQDQLPPKRGHDITMSRAKLNGGTAPLEFLKWDGNKYSQPGIGGHEVPILTDGPIENCGDVRQERGQASISFVKEARQYLLTFVCKSLGDPAGGVFGGAEGSAIFYATTYELSHPQWSAPREIIGSWAVDDNGSGGPDNCAAHSRYPTFMSLNHKPSFLALNGYVFSMQGCVGEGIHAKRRYVSHAFTITIR